MRQVLILTILLLTTALSAVQAQSNFAPPRVARTQQQTESATPKGRPKATPKAQPQKPKQEAQPQKSVPSFEQMNDYELELKASSGSTDAQYALGRRWLLRGDSINVVKGVNMLKVAAQHGSQQARNLLKTVKH